MSLIAMCAYCTEENGKLNYLKETLDSLKKTVDWSKHRLFIINNSTYEEAIKFLHKTYFDDIFNENIYIKNSSIYIKNSPINLGTARGINLALKARLPEEYCIKCDDDWTTDHAGWVEEMEQQIELNNSIGILGLKRDDVYGDFIEDKELLWNKDIMGTCTMYNWRLLNKIGYLSQPSQYGFDDTIFSVRSEAARFKNAFMKNIKIKNLDEGGTEYTEWKKREAGVYLQEVSIYMDMIKKGELSYYYDGGF